jgi:hypothetical protein
MQGSPRHPKAADIPRNGSSNIGCRWLVRQKLVMGKAVEQDSHAVEFHYMQRNEKENLLKPSLADLL